MDWTQEDTELLQLMNRCRHLISVRQPEAYQRLADPKLRTAVRTRIEDYVIELMSHGQRLVVYDLSKGKFSALLDVKMDGGRPHYSFGLDRVRADVVPAIDRAMVLEDLSIL